MITNEIIRKFLIQILVLLIIVVLFSYLYLLIYGISFTETHSYATQYRFHWPILYNSFSSGFQFVIFGVFLAFTLRKKLYPTMITIYSFLFLYGLIKTSYFPEIDSGIDNLMDFIFLFCDEFRSVVETGMPYIFYIATPFLILYVFYIWVRNPSFEEDTLKLEKILVSNRTKLDTVIIVLSIISLSIAVYYKGTDFVLDVFFPDTEFSYELIRDFIALLSIIIGSFFTHNFINKYWPNKKMAKTFPKFFIIPIIVSTLIYLSAFQITWGYSLLFGEANLDTLREDIIVHYNWMPLYPVWMVCMIIASYGYAKTFGFPKREGYFNPDDHWLPHNNIFHYPLYMNIAISDFKNGRINKEKVLKALDKGIKEMIKQQKDYEHLLSLWDTVVPLSSQEWQEFGNKKGSRRTEYSQESISDFKRIYKEWIREIELDINKIREIRANIYQGKNRAFGNSDTNNSNSGHSSDNDFDF